MSWRPERPKVVIPEGLPNLPDAFAYIWPDDDNDCCFQHNYTPSTPRRGKYSIAIYTEEQMLDYAAKAVKVALGV